MSLGTVTQTMIYVRNAWAMAETGWGWGSAGSRTAWAVSGDGLAGRWRAVALVYGWLHGGRTRGSWVLSLRFTCVGLCRFGEAWAALGAENLLTYLRTLISVGLDCASV